MGPDFIGLHGFNDDLGRQKPSMAAGEVQEVSDCQPMGYWATGSLIGSGKRLLLHKISC